jgi:hypothetical protein
MKQISFFLFFLFTLSVNGQDFNYYQPLVSSGKLPADLLISSTSKYKNDLEEINKSKTPKSEANLKKQYYLESNFKIDWMLQNGMVIFDEEFSHYASQVASQVTITSNSPVTPGNVVRLSAPVVENAKYYWEASNGNRYFEREIVFGGEAANMGLYKLKIDLLGCIIEARTVVVVGSFGAPCFPNLNVLFVRNGSNGFISNVTGAVNNSNYEILAHANNFDIHLTTFAPHIPDGDVVEIVSTPNIQKYQCYLTLTNANETYIAQSGGVFIKPNNSNRIISFCDVDFVSTTTGSVLNCNAKFTL